MSGGLFGWNLLYSSVAADIRNNEDVLVCLTHLVMISNGFQCIGIGDSKNMDGSELKSETLPRGWNDAYALRYVYQGRLYNLQGTKLDDGIMINLIRTDERNVSLLQLNSSYVVQRHGTLDEMVPNNKDIVKMVKDQLLDKVTTSTKTRESTSQTPVQPQPQSSTRNSLPDYSGPRSYPYSMDPIGVGRNDLDPLGGMVGPRLGSMPGLGPVGGIGPLGPGGGGMLFQPPSRLDPARTGLPYGALPPGARFDPFRPPDNPGFHPPPRRPNPDNDDFPPPGFDDMYM